MYLINKDTNRISKLSQRSFSELQFKEREHLQEWIANNPESLGEELLIIQKEFSGFNETNERLDLLALDKEGNLVIIENKLDDSGKDVTWQAIKYASYCAGLTKQDILQIFQEYLGKGDNAEDKLSEFYDNKEFSELVLNHGQNSQRLILIAAHFRKEVTSSVLWLMNFKIKIQCFKVTPFELNSQLFLNVEQILPTKEAEEFAISFAKKAQIETDIQQTLKNRHQIRLKFWEQFIAASNSKNNLFSSHSPNKDNWIGKGIGMSGISLNLVITSNSCRAEIFINRGNKEENKEIFDALLSNKKEIEDQFGNKLIWEKLEDRITSRVKYEKLNLNYFNEEDWNDINILFIETSVRMEKAFKTSIQELNKTLKSR